MGSIKDLGVSPTATAPLVNGANELSPPSGRVSTDAALWQQNGPTDQGMCLIEIGNRISVEITGSMTAGVSDDEVQRVAELIIAAPVLANLLARIEPHLGAIICYASTIGEHEPNGIAADISGWLGHLRDCGAIAKAQGEA